MNSYPADYGTAAGDDVDMKPFNSSILHASTVDSSSLAHRFPVQLEHSHPEYESSQLHSDASSLLMPSASKGKTAKKKTKGEEADDGRSQADEEEIDVDKYVNLDSGQVSVKILRKVIPKLRISCYFSDEQMSGKRKFKHLWDERPSDWPPHIPFKDPNNAVKDARKPGKDELGPMFTFLKSKYQELKQFRGRPAGESEHIYSSSMIPSEVFAAPVPSSHAVPTESTDSQLMFSQEDSKLWYHAPQPNVVQWPEEHAVLVPTRTEQLPRDMQQSMMTTLVTQPLVSQHVAAVNGSGEAALPSPVRDIYQRLAEKQQHVTLLSGNSQDVSHLLNEVHRAVIHELYKNLIPTSSELNTRLCLMFIDAAHQYEAMLDVLLILGQIDITFLKSGCDELIKKFNKDCMSVMPVQFLPGSGVLTSMFGRVFPTAAIGKQQCDDGSSWTSANSAGRCGDQFPQYSHREHADSTSADDMAQFGINIKADGHHRQCVTHLIDKRSSPSPILEDDDKMNIDEEAVSKLLAKFFDQQHLKVCETQPQVMTPVTECNVESRSVVAVSGESETTMDCTESEMLNDVVDIISNDVFNKQSPHLDLCGEDSSSRLMVEPFSLSSNSDAASCEPWSLPVGADSSGQWSVSAGAASSGQWSLPVGADSSGQWLSFPAAPPRHQQPVGAAGIGQWSLPVGVDLYNNNMSPPRHQQLAPSSLSSADQHFTLSQAQFDHHLFQSLPTNIASDSYNVPSDQVQSYGLSPPNQLSDENLLLTNNVAWYREAAVVEQWHQPLASANADDRPVAPIPACVSNASYEDFDSDETKQRGSRGSRSKRGSSVSSVRSGKAVDRCGRKT